MLLLDSQVVLWVLGGSPKLRPSALRRIEAAATTHVSAATVWELTIKSMLGKVTIPADFATRLTGEGFVELPVTHADAAAIGNFPEIVHHDPFDRLLVAQAARANLHLLTADRVLLGLGHDFIIDATV